MNSQQWELVLVLLQLRFFRCTYRNGKSYESPHFHSHHQTDVFGDRGVDCLSPAVGSVVPVVHNFTLQVGEHSIGRMLDRVLAFSA